MHSLQQSCLETLKLCHAVSRYYVFLLIMLNSKQQKFCHEYIIDQNGAQAAIRAGYSPRAANVKGAQLLTIVSIRTKIQSLQNEIAARLKLDAESIAMEYKSIGFSNITDYLNSDFSLKDISRLPRFLTAAIESIKIRKVGNAVYTEIKLLDKLKALEALAKHLGMFGEHRVQKEKQSLDLSKLTEEERSQIARLLMKAA